MKNREIPKNPFLIPYISNYILLQMVYKSTFSKNQNLNEWVHNIGRAVSVNLPDVYLYNI